MVIVSFFLRKDGDGISENAGGETGRLAILYPVPLTSQFQTQSINFHGETSDLCPEVCVLDLKLRNDGAPFFDDLSHTWDDLLDLGDSDRALIDNSTGLVSTVLDDLRNDSSKTGESAQGGEDSDNHDIRPRFVALTG